MKNSSGKSGHLRVLPGGVLGRLLLFLICFVVLCGCASAYVEYYAPGTYADQSMNNRITLHNEMSAYRNLTWLEGQVNNASLLRNEGKTWYLNSSISLDSSNLYINSSDCDVLYMSNQVNGIRSGQGGILNGLSHIDGVTIYSWDYNTSSVPDAMVNQLTATNQFGIVVDSTGEISNSVLEGVLGVTLNSHSGQTVENITMNNSFSHFQFADCSNMIIQDMHMSHMAQGKAVYVARGHDNHVYNCTIHDAAGGVVFEDSDNSTMDNITVDLTDWMGCEVDTGANNCSMSNLTINRARHSGIDIHGASNLLIENVHITNSTSNSIQLTGSGSPVHKTWNITLRDIYTANSSYIDPMYPDDGRGGTGISMSPETIAYPPVENITIINMTAIDENNAMELNKVDNATVINFTAIGCNNGIFTSTAQTKNFTVIDSSFVGCDVVDLSLTAGSIIDLVNTNYSSTDFIDSESIINTYFYPNVRVINSASSGIQGAIITTNTTSKNGNGIIQTSFVSDSDGKLYDDGNKSNWLALPSISKTQSATTTYTPEIAASISGFSDSEIVNPSVTWYSENPENLQGDLITLTLGNATESINASVNGEYYSTIQGAINAATSWDTVYIYPGIYTENILINKSISVEGSSGNSEDVILKTAGGTNTVEITADGAALRYVSVNDNTVSNGMGIKINEADNCIIEDCAVKRTGYYSIYNTNSYNTIIKNTYIKGEPAGYGLVVIDPGLSRADYNVSVSNCTIWGSQNNIRLSFAAGTEFRDCYLQGDINFWGGDSNTFINNIFTTPISNDKMHFEAASSNLFYNNIFMFNASNINYNGACSGNKFSLDSLAAGSGIGGNTQIGGNIWTTETFTDANSDGFSDSAYTVSEGMSSVDSYPVVYNVSTATEGSTPDMTWIGPHSSEIEWNTCTDENFSKYVLYRGFTETGKTNYKVFESTNVSEVSFSDIDSGMFPGRRNYYTLETQYENGTSYYSSVEAWSIHHTKKECWIEGDSISSYPYFDSPTNLGWVEQLKTDYFDYAGWTLECTAVSGKTVNTSMSTLQSYSQLYDGELFITEIGINDKIANPTTATPRDVNESYADVYNQTKYMAVRGSTSYWLTVMPDDSDNIWQKSFTWSAIARHPPNVTIINGFDSLDSIIENGNFDDYNFTTEMGGSVHPNTLGGSFIAKKVFRLLCMDGSIQNETYFPMGSDSSTPSISARNPRYAQIKYDGSTTNFNATLSEAADTAWYINDVFTNIDYNTATPDLPLAVKSSDYTISARAMNPENYSAYTTTEWVPVPPVANFTANITTGEHPLTVLFNDTSSGATSWSWDFNNDGAADSTSQNATYTYSAAGNYTVNLTATNEDGSDSEAKTEYIHVTAVPDANFTSNVTQGSWPLSVQFNDTSVDSPTSWTWNFGDGNTSTDQNATHVYSTKGNYTVTLTATNEYGSDVETKANYTYVMPQPPVAAFSATPQVGNVLTVISFTDASTEPSTWAWDFNSDGVIDSTAQNPYHTYPAGTYTVTLTVTNAAGLDTEVKADYITIEANPGTDPLTWFYWWMRSHWRW